MWIHYEDNLGEYELWFNIEKRILIKLLEYKAPNAIFTKKKVVINDEYFQDVMDSGDAMTIVNTMLKIDPKVVEMKDIEVSDFFTMMMSEENFYEYDEERN